MNLGETLVLHEALHLYDAAKDAVGHTVLRIEHHPGQLDRLVEFLSELKNKAGVYFAEIESKVVTPEPPAEGETHGEPEVQRINQQPEAAGDGQGNQPEESGAAAGESSGADSELA